MNPKPGLCNLQVGVIHRLKGYITACLSFVTFL